MKKTSASTILIASIDNLMTVPGEIIVAYGQTFVDVFNENSVVSDVDFSGVSAPGFDFGSRSFFDCDFRNTIFTEFRNANNFYRCSLGNADFSGGDFAGASQVWPAKFASSRLVGAKFAGLTMATYETKPENRPDFRRVVADRADFSGCCLYGADFSGASLKGVNFSGAVLTRANFDRADISGAKFDGAKLAGASFWRTLIEKADFSGAKLDSGPLCNIRKPMVGLPSA